ncbi:MAG TPA: glycosyltransferase family 4 protein [Acidimicrobiales bacterium]|nr:glycosyltransferase family 4 protein [Acidimicrobiales bacterium]
MAVPPPLYGGTEVVIDGLARGLQAAGHEVVLFATGDSTCPVPLNWAYPQALGTLRSDEAELHQAELAYKALVGEVDIIHDHTLLGPWRCLSHPCPTPVVTTVHSPFSCDTLRVMEAVSRRLPVVAISGAQAASAPSVEVAAVIHHGLDTDAFPLGPGDGGYVAFLGRMSEEKGPDRAIAVARAAGVPIRLAAKMRDPLEVDYFARRVEPVLGPDASFIGEVGGDDKLDFLGRAVALVNPIRWPEPFGMAMIEAMACGTPVLSFAEGSAPELIQGGVNGYLCRDGADMAGAVARARGLDRARCRASVEARFSLERMVQDHVTLYRRVIRGSSGSSAR